MSACLHVPGDRVLTRDRNRSYPYSSVMTILDAGDSDLLSTQRPPSTCERAHAARIDSLVTELLGTLSEQCRSAGAGQRRRV
ncbi:uncharacterized conserved protein [Moesziomyces antarcticus T-34]|uniref:Uncharacterized conserved protein n=1 Tax=Pseudozyma antarctica (strain T-34) TaxID=1151754 RepID=M9LT29_PSEA3|nr:uncharacterized conserved protein [Moesziomyces antarcticus T-34]